jgi:hypothetical protein
LEESLYDVSEINVQSQTSANASDHCAQGVPVSRIRDSGESNTLEESLYDVSEINVQSQTSANASDHCAQGVPVSPIRDSGESNTLEESLYDVSEINVQSQTSANASDHRAQGEIPLNELLDAVSLSFLEMSLEDGYDSDSDFI